MQSFASDRSLTCTISKQAPGNGCEAKAESQTLLHPLVSLVAAVRFVLVTNDRSGLLTGRLNVVRSTSVMAERTCQPRYQVEWLFDFEGRPITRVGAKDWCRSRSEVRRCRLRLPIEPDRKLQVVQVCCQMVKNWVAALAVGQQNALEGAGPSIPENLSGTVPQKIAGPRQIRPRRPFLCIVCGTEYPASL